MFFCKTTDNSTSMDANRVASCFRALFNTVNFSDIAYKAVSVLLCLALIIIFRIDIIAAIIISGIIIMRMNMQSKKAN